MKNIFLISLTVMLCACGSKTLTGTPTWCAIGEDYKVHKEVSTTKVYGLINESRWFNYDRKLHGYPKSIFSLPTSYNGSKLTFYIRTDKKDPSYLIFDLILKNSDKADVFKELTPERSNLMPFLFTVYADSAAVKAKEAPLRKHSKGSLVRIIHKGNEKTWTFKVSTKSILDITGDHKSKELHIFACFGERLHTSYNKANKNREVPEAPSITILNKTIKPDKIIRSNHVFLDWDGEQWKKIEIE